MKLSVIVPVYNALNDVQQCLNSIVANLKVDSEVIIIDDCSDAETQNWLSDFVANHSDFSLCRNIENLGFLQTCNKAMQQASGDVVVLLNSDTMIPCGFSKKVLDCFNSCSDIGIACPLLSNTGQPNIEIKLPKNKNIQDINDLLDNKHTTTYPFMSCCNGSCFCIRKEVIQKIGYLDEIYGKGYYEEVDFCCRAISNGFKCALIDNLYVWHKWHASFSSADREALLKKNEKIFYSRWGDFTERWTAKYGYNNYARAIIKEILPFQYYTSKLNKITRFIYRKQSGWVKIFKIPVLKLKDE